jgi:hypothetical protein
MKLKELIGEAEYATLRGVSLRTVQRERALRYGPPFIKLGGKVMYDPAMIDAWLTKQVRNQPPLKKSA